MNVVVTSFGSAGDFNPLLAIAAALHRRGADVTFVANPFYEPRVVAVGCRFVGAGRWFDVLAAIERDRGYLHSRAAFVRIWNELGVPSIREIHPVVRGTIRSRGATAVVSHVLSYARPGAARDRAPRPRAREVRRARRRRLPHRANAVVAPGTLLEPGTVVGRSGLCDQDP